MKPVAYAYARMRALKSRLLTRGDAAPLFLASTTEEMQRVLDALELRDPMVRLRRVYDTAIRGYPHGAALFRALLGLHEIEDVKRGGAVSPAYTQIVKTVKNIHGNDVAAAELAFDRWASQRVREEAQKLPHREALARQLAEAVIRERDAQLQLRGAKWYGLTSIKSEAIDIAGLRRERLRLCRRAFVGSPFLLAPALAVILLAEEEVRAIRALVERQGDETLDAILERALAASEIGA